jgi:hypothetical protein
MAKRNRRYIAAFSSRQAGEFEKGSAEKYSVCSRCQ